MEEIKYCSSCKKQLPVSQFVKNKRSSDGYAIQCKACVKQYQLSIKDKLKAYQHDYQKKYKAEHKKELNEYLLNWQNNNREKVRAYVKKSNAKRIEAKKIYDKEYRLRKKLEKQQNEQ